MEVQTVMALCQALPYVTWDCPFGPQPRCYRVKHRIFAEIYPTGVEGALGILLEDESVPRNRVVPMVTLRCEPAYGDFLRRQFPGAVLRPYHSPPAQQPCGNTVLLGNAVPGDVWREMIRHAYHQVVGKLPKKVQREMGEPHP